MLKDFTVVQHATPNGVASMCFGGAYFKYEGYYPEGDNKTINNYLLNAVCLDSVYTHPIKITDIIRQVKVLGMKLIIGMNEVMRKDIPLVSYDHFGRVAGVIADILQENGFTNETAYINLINEPRGRWHLTEMSYVQYCQRANNYVKGRFPLIIGNDEYHIWNEKLILEQTANIPNKIWGVHHLSSLDSEMKNVVYAKTEANEFKVKIACNEGGSWFKDYQKSEGHQINKKLIQMCADRDYVFFSICLPDTNEASRKIWSTLGYRIWYNDYSKIKYQNNWADFENFIKQFRKVVITMYDVPERLKVLAEELGIKIGEYDETLPVLTGSGIWQNHGKIHKPNQYVAKRDLDCLVEKLLNIIGLGIHLYYNADGTWNPKWEAIAKEKPIQ